MRGSRRLNDWQTDWTSDAGTNGRDTTGATDAGCVGRCANRALLGSRRSFDLPVSSAGTVHDHAVWQALRDIPPGETRSYGDIARTVRSSPRAVGGACGRNPLPIIVPCHRIVAAGGALGGYSGPGGLQTKQFLLKLEGACEADGVPLPRKPPDSPICLPLFRHV